MDRPEVITGPLPMMIMSGALVGLGQLLNSKEQLTPRLILGRAITSGLLGATFGMVTIWLPDVSNVVLFGGAAAVASLGVSGLERILQRVVGK